MGQDPESNLYHRNILLNQINLNQKKVYMSPDLKEDIIVLIIEKIRPSSNYTIGFYNVIIIE